MDAMDARKGLRIDMEHETLWIDGQRRHIHFAPLEKKLLLFLASRNGEVCPRTEIAEAVYDEQYNKKVHNDSLDALVGRIRRKIEPHPRKPRFLITAHRKGHALKEYIHALDKPAE